MTPEQRIAEARELAETVESACGCCPGEDHDVVARVVRGLADDLEAALAVVEAGLAWYEDCAFSDAERLREALLVYDARSGADE